MKNKVNNACHSDAHYVWAHSMYVPLCYCMSCSSETWLKTLIMIKFMHHFCYQSSEFFLLRHRNQNDTSPDSTVTTAILLSYSMRSGSIFWFWCEMCLGESIWCATVCLEERWQVTCTIHITLLSFRLRTSYTGSEFSIPKWPRHFYQGFRRKYDLCTKYLHR